MFWLTRYYERRSKALSRSIYRKMRARYQAKPWLMKGKTFSEIWDHMKEQVDFDY